MMKHFKTLFAATLLWLAAATPALAQSLIRDAEIEQTLREWTDPILEVSGLQPEDVGL